MVRPDSTNCPPARRRCWQTRRRSITQPAVVSRMTLAVIACAALSSRETAACAWVNTATSSAGDCHASCSPANDGTRRIGRLAAARDRRGWTALSRCQVSLGVLRQGRHAGDSPLGEAHRARAGGQGVLPAAGAASRTASACRRCQARSSSCGCRCEPGRAVSSVTPTTQPLGTNNTFMFCLSRV